MKCKGCGKTLEYVYASLGALGIDVDNLYDDEYIKEYLIDSINYLRIKDLGIEYICPECSEILNIDELQCEAKTEA